MELRRQSEACPPNAQDWWERRARPRLCLRYRDSIRLKIRCTLKRVLTSGHAVESQVEFEHIDAWLAEQTEEAAARICGDELPEHIFGQIASLCNARHLEQGRFRGDVRIKSAARRGYEIGRNWSRRILLFQLFNVALDAFDQRLAGWPKV